MRLAPLLIAGTVVASVSAQTPLSEDVQETKRGIAGVLAFEFAGPLLVERPDQAVSAPMRVRLTRISESEYEATYIGIVEGEYDLRNWIQNADGVQPTSLDPLPVRVTSALPSDHGTDIFGPAGAVGRVRGGYRAMLTVGAILWVLVPVAFIVHRRMRRRVEEAPEERARPLTLADQLRPLVKLAAAQRLDTDERGALELLLFRYWRQRLHLTGEIGVALRTLRQHSDAGPLLHALEGWLHQRAATELTPGELAVLLKPYADAPVDESVAIERTAEEVRT